MMYIKTFPLEQPKTSIQFLVFIQIIIFNSKSIIESIILIYIETYKRDSKYNY